MFNDLQLFNCFFGHFNPFALEKKVTQPIASIRKVSDNKLTEFRKTSNSIESNLMILFINKRFTFLITDRPQSGLTLDKTQVAER